MCGSACTGEAKGAELYSKNLSQQEGRSRGKDKEPTPLTV